MERDEIRKLLRRVRAGSLPVEQALERLHLEPLEKLEFATLDLSRALRRGFPEVVYGPGKTPEQIAEIVRRLHQAGQSVLVTRAPPEAHALIASFARQAVHHPLARAITLTGGRRPASRAGITVITAGTSDLPVAEEAVVTAETMGNRVLRIVDVGIAGVHRLLAHRDTLVGSRVIVVVAGMEGALPSLVAGLTACPVIGVPTSTGYGSGEGGRAALLAMLNSCVPGLTVVNVDNGFGAGYAASMINRMGTRKRRE